MMRFPFSVTIFKNSPDSLNISLHHFMIAVIQTMKGQSD
jgi:hypothetical protein